MQEVGLDIYVIRETVREDEDGRSLDVGLRCHDEKVPYLVLNDRRQLQCLTQGGKNDVIAFRVCCELETLDCGQKIVSLIILVSNQQL